jgi:hypothetical protein
VLRSFLTREKNAIVLDSGDAFSDESLFNTFDRARRDLIVALPARRWPKKQMKGGRKRSQFKTRELVVGKTESVSPKPQSFKEP